jgi:hypothetical protein
MQLHLRGLRAGTFTCNRHAPLCMPARISATRQKRSVLRAPRSNEPDIPPSEMMAEASPIQSMAQMSLDPEAKSDAIEGMELDQEVFKTESGIVEPVSEDEAEVWPWNLHAHCMQDASMHPAVCMHANMRPAIRGGDTVASTGVPSGHDGCCGHGRRAPCPQPAGLAMGHTRMCTT